MAWPYDAKDRLTCGITPVGVIGTARRTAGPLRWSSWPLRRTETTASAGRSHTAACASPGSSSPSCRPTGRLIARGGPGGAA